MGVVASESAAYCPLRSLGAALGFGALAVVISEVGANAVVGAVAVDCAAADAIRPTNMQAKTFIFANLYVHHLSLKTSTLPSPPQARMSSLKFFLGELYRRETQSNHCNRSVSPFI